MATTKRRIDIDYLNLFLKKLTSMRGEHYYSFELFPHPPDPGGLPQGQHPPLGGVGTSVAVRSL